jgi:uncharacterized protein YfdQ (DUF2303 family)
MNMTSSNPNASPLGTSTLTGTGTKPEAMALAEQLMANTAATLKPVTIDEATFVTLPPGYSLENITAQLEKANPNRNRAQGTAVLGDVDSLLAYCDDQQMQDSGYIYADPDRLTITAVFNDQRNPSVPGWRDHRASFSATTTPEMKKWLANDKKQMGQTEFAEFLEDNFADLAGADAQTLLNVATTIQATTGINFASARRLQDGQTQLTYNEVVDAKAGADGALKIPQTFALGLRIFKNGDAYKLTARLKYRLHSGSVKFWYELDRPERAVEDAFAGYVAAVREKSGYRVLIGMAG